MKKKKWIIAGIAAAALIAAGGFWISRNSGGSGGDAVFVVPVSSMNQQITADRFAGVVESQQTVDFKQAPGRTIEEILVSTGDTVLQGTPLFRYSTTDAENKIASANLEIENYSNQISILSASGNSTDIQLQIRQLQYQIQVQQQAIAGSQQEIDNAEVKSTIDGIVKSVNETGTSDNGMEAPIVTVAETGDFRVKGKISEQSVGMMQAGMQVFVRSRVNENQLWYGEITSVETEPEQNNEGMYYGGGESASKYPFYVSLEKTDGLMLGQHVYIEPNWGQGEAKEGLWLDMGYIGYSEDGTPYVWVGTSGRLKKVNITAGATDEQTFQVEILDGLSEDDLIAWPDESLQEGQKAVSASEGA